MKKSPLRFWLEILLVGVSLGCLQMWLISVLNHQPSEQIPAQAPAVSGHTPAPTPLPAQYVEERLQVRLAMVDKDNDVVAASLILSLVSTVPPKEYHNAKVNVSAVNWDKVIVKTREIVAASKGEDLATQAHLKELLRQIALEVDATLKEAKLDTMLKRHEIAFSEFIVIPASK